ncbi:MAG: phage terminase large subunit, partial [Tistlia sp.]
MAEAAALLERIEPTPFQSRVLATPEDCDLFLGGGRGGGKTFALLLLILRHVETYGSHARVLVVRRDFPSLRDFEAEARFLFGTAYGRALGYNASQHLFRFPNGATVQLDQIEGPQDFAKYQGKSFSLIEIDEAGQFPDAQPLDLLRSSLRSKAGIPCRFVLSANPGGPGHGWLHQRHVAGVSPWTIYVEPKSRRNFITAASTLADNPHLAADYAGQLVAATSTDPALQKAWLHGDWNIAAGAFFGGVFDTRRNVVPAWASLPGSVKGGGLLPPALWGPLRRRSPVLEAPPRSRWEHFVAGDHGSA